MSGQRILWICMFFITASAAGQVPSVGNKPLLRIYHDNDLFNMPGWQSDQAYTGGIRFDVFFQKNHPSRFFLDRIFPQAGKGSVDVFQWGLMQVMFTPKEIEETAYQPHDYYYSAGLFAIHSMYSYSPQKKYSFQTQIDAGWMGPPALGEETQKLVHRIIHYQQPMGWDNQLKSDVLLNLYFTAEKQLAHLNNIFEFIGGGRISAGTELNAVAVYGLFRTGFMRPYFDGILSQFAPGKKMQFYFIIKPQFQWVVTDALVQGGLFSHNPPHPDNKGILYATGPELRPWVFDLSVGAVLSVSKFSLSYTLNNSTRLISKVSDHQFGNISLYLNL